MTTDQDDPGGGTPRGWAVSPNAVILAAVWLALGLGLLVAPSPGPLVFLFVVSGWILAVTVHEFCHAWVAFKAGDHTIPAKGYLTLDPLKYTDLSTSLILPLIVLALGGVGFPGGAVYLRNDLMRSPLWRAAASLAGPAGTLLALLVLAGLLQPVMALGAAPLAEGLGFLAFLQATALFLNLLPIPGLDGYGVIRPFLPSVLRKPMAQFERFGLLLLLAGFFFIPGVAAQLFAASLELTAALGIPDLLVRSGYAAFAFWR